MNTPRYETTQDAWDALPPWRAMHIPLKSRCAAVAEWADELNGFWNNRFIVHLLDAPEDMCEEDKFMYAMNKVEGMMWLEVNGYRKTGECR